MVTISLTVQELGFLNEAIGASIEAAEEDYQYEECETAVLKAAVLRDVKAKVSRASEVSDGIEVGASDSLLRKSLSHSG